MLSHLEACVPRRSMTRSKSNMGLRLQAGVSMTPIEAGVTRQVKRHDCIAAAQAAWSSGFINHVAGVWRPRNPSLRRVPIPAIPSTITHCRRGRAPDMAWRIGVDIGGTFTDVALVDDASGQIGVAKVPTTPRDFVAGRARGAGRWRCSRYGIAPAEVGLLCARHDRRHQRHPRGEGRARGADHHARLPRRAGAAALGARRPLRPVPGCAGHADPAPAAVRDHRAHRRRRRSRHAARRKRDRRADRGAEGGAGRGDCGLAAVQLPQPGARAAGSARGCARRCRTCPSICPREVLPEIKEFERTSTTAVCAYVGPILPPIWRGWSSATREHGPAAALPDGLERRRPRSGARPSPCRRWRWSRVRRPAWWRRRWWRARPAGSNLLSFDMGGTTAKASLIRDGQYETTPEYEVGGGSSVHALDERHRPSDPRAGDRSRRGLGRRRLDRLGRPRRRAARRPEERRRRSRARSAMRRGGTEPTVTDCNLLLGYLDKGSLLGGDLPHRSCSSRGRRRASGSPSRSASMCARPRPPSSTSSTTPWRKCSRSSPCNAATIRAISCWPPSAAPGPLHAAALAERARHRRGASARRSRARSRRSAWSARICKRDYVRTVYTTTGDRRSRGARGCVRRTRSAGRRACSTVPASPPERRRFERSVDARYARQSYELPMPVPRGAIDAGSTRSRSPRPFTTVTCKPTATTTAASRCRSSASRLAAIGAIPPLSIRDSAGAVRDDAVKSEREVWFRETGAVDGHDL